MTKNPIEGFEGAKGYAMIAPYNPGWLDELGVDDPQTAKEILEETDQAIETLELKEKERKDPLGEIQELRLVANSDFHLPSAEPEKMPTVTISPYKQIAKAADLIGRGLGREKDWMSTQRQELFFEAVMAHVEEIKQIIVNLRKEIGKKGKALIMVSLGDKDLDAATASDVNYAARVLSDMTRAIEEDIDNVQGGRPTSPQNHAIILTGDHGVDPKRHGPARFLDEEKYYGFQYFYQRVGKANKNGFLVVGLCTPLLDPWLEGKLKEMKNSSEGNKAWEIFQRERRSQVGLIEEAARIAQKEGRNVILLGHKQKELGRLVKPPEAPQKHPEASLPAIPNVTHLVAGHLHSRKLELLSVRNSRGENVRLIRPGAPTVGAFGVEKRTQPTMDLLTIEQGKEAQVEEIEIKPETIRGLL